MSWLDHAGAAATALYALATLFLVGQGLHCLWLLFLFVRYRRRGGSGGVPRPGGAPQGEAEAVLVQLPVYNERHVVERVLAAAGRLDWPRDALRIQLLDDSTDDTSQIGADAVARLRAAGVDAVHVRRGSREGYKAGALEHGLALDARHPRGPASFVAIFDADFVPPSDFLLRSVPRLAGDPGLAFVQGRWEHLNASSGVLTGAQAIGIDGHFAIEQGARAWSGLALNFNGTCGVWRRAAIEDAGGWQHDTLTEDLDLSYRAQLKGWRAAYDASLAVPGEIPATLEAWRSQQFRWAKGSIQTARKLLPSIWTSPWPFRRKLAATLHLTHYFVHPAILATLVLAPFVVRWQGHSLPLSLVVGLPLVAAGLLPPLVLYASSQLLLGRPARRLLWLPALMSFGVGIAVSNTRAVWEALRGRVSAFVRTPKQGDGGHSYRAAPALGLPELGMACWGAVGLLSMSSASAPWFAPLLLLYTAGFFAQGSILLARRVFESCDGAKLRPSDSMIYAALVPAAAGSTAALAFLSASWREQPLLYAGLGLLLGGAMFALLVRVHAAPPGRGATAAILLSGVLLQILATGLPTSDDVNRYVVEGVQVLHGENPYAVAPDATGLPVDPAVRAEVNHADMTAIYPPAMLGVHGVVQALLPGRTGFRFFSILAVLATGVLILSLLVQERKSPAYAAAWLWNPVVVLHLSGEAHHDAFMALPLVAALIAYRRGRPALAIVLASAAALLKPVAAPALLFLLLATGVRRAWIPATLALLLYLPFLGAGTGLFRSLVAFGGGMNFHGVIEPTVRTLLSPFASGGDRALLVRIVLLCLLGILFAWLYAKSRGAPLPSRIARATALLLAISPTLHPWYFTALAALLPFSKSRALAAWTGAASLYWLHGVAMPEGEPWAEWPVATAVAHVPFFVWMALESLSRAQALENQPAPGRPAPGASWSAGLDMEAR